MYLLEKRLGRERGYECVLCMFSFEFIYTELGKAKSNQPHGHKTNRDKLRYNKTNHRM